LIDLSFMRIACERGSFFPLFFKIGNHNIQDFWHFFCCPKRKIGGKMHFLSMVLSNKGRSNGPTRQHLVSFHNFKHYRLVRLLVFLGQSRWSDKGWPLDTLSLSPSLWSVSFTFLACAAYCEILLRAGKTSNM
jgi:hypothetical protein